MQLAKGAEHLRPEPQGAGPPGMVPGGRIGGDLEVFGRGTHRGERIALDVVEIDLARRLAPVLVAGIPGAQSGRDQYLALRGVVAIERTELEEGRVGKPAIC